MMFHERVHAYIAARYYVRLTEAFGERGREAFIHAVRYYGEQRGRRMAQRAIRDGEPLTFSTYCRYGEWMGTAQAEKEGIGSSSLFLSYDPDAVQKITRCPWHHQFRSMGLELTAGAEYCRHLDSAIARGFNPDLTYEVSQTLQTADCCIHRMKNAGFDKTADLSRKTEYVRSFEYHCAHSFWSFRSVAEAVFGSQGESIASLVLKDVADDFGREAADTLMHYRNTDFNSCLS